MNAYRTVEGAINWLDEDSVVPNKSTPNHRETTVVKYHATLHGESVFGGEHQYRLPPDEPSHTVTASNYHFHPCEPRGLSIREQASIQSFPGWWEFTGSRTKNQILVGNAVPPRLARYVAEVMR